MSKYPLAPKEQIELLKNLLLTEQERQKTLASTFHSKKNDLLLAGFPLQRLGKLEQNVKDIAEVKEIIQNFSSDARVISKAIFPAIVDMNGLLTGFRQFFTDFAKINPALIVTFSSSDPELPKINKLTQVNIYKVCTEIIEFISQSGSTQLIFNIALHKGNLEIEIKGINIKKSLSKPKELAEKLNLIKGRMILCNVIILPETDWKRFFKLRFKVK